MNTEDLQDWFSCEKTMSTLGFSYKIKGNYIDLYLPDFRFGGSFKSIGDLYMYLLGYKDGLNAPRSGR